MTKQYPFPVPIEQAAALQQCPECNLELPSVEFIVSLDQHGGEVRTLCRNCHEKQPAKKQATKEAAEKAEAARELVQKLSKVTVGTISDLAFGLLHRFGGMDGFTQFYHDQISAAASTGSGKGSTRVLRACEAVTRVVTASTAYQVGLGDVAEMSDVELAAEMDRLTLESVAKLSLEDFRKLKEQADGGGDGTRQLA